MANYVLVYSGGRIPEPEEREAVTAAWGRWLGALGDAVVDAGNPFGSSAAVASDGSVSQGAPSGLSGYSVITADSLDAATQHAKSCPHLDAGGRVDVYETFEVK
jgi:hypothetical protein